MTRRQFPDPLSSPLPEIEDVAAFLHDLANMVERGDMAVTKCTSTRVDNPGGELRFPTFCLALECINFPPKNTEAVN
jgi:hypothetical protein